jgi:hypothetical protein
MPAEMEPVVASAAHGAAVAAAADQRWVVLKAVPAEVLSLTTNTHMVPAAAAAAEQRYSPSIAQLLL